MPNCQICGKTVVMPFVCKYCYGSFCAEHRLPENHNCTRVSTEKSWKDEMNNRNWQKRQMKKPKFVSEGDYHFTRKSKSHRQLKKISSSILAIIGAIILLLIVGLLFFAPILFDYVLMPMTVDVNEVENKVFELINEERNERGLPTLLSDPKLQLIANEWSEELIEIGNLTHGDFSQRVAQIGYSHYQCGEIIAWQNGWTWDISRDFVNGWIESSGHYKIMMTASSGYMGVGVSKDGSNFYAVVDFRFN